MAARAPIETPDRGFCPICTKFDHFDPSAKQTAVSLPRNGCYVDICESCHLTAAWKTTTSSPAEQRASEGMPRCCHGVYDPLGDGWSCGICRQLSAQSTSNLAWPSYAKPVKNQAFARLWQHPLTAALRLIQDVPQPPDHLLDNEGVSKAIEALSAKALLRELKKASGGGEIQISFVADAGQLHKVFPGRMISKGEHILRFPAGDERGQALFILHAAAQELFRLYLQTRAVNRDYWFEVNEFLMSLWFLVASLLEKRSNAPEICVRRLAFFLYAVLYHPGHLSNEEVQSFVGALAICDDPKLLDPERMVKIATILTYAKVRKDEEAIRRLWQDHIRGRYVRAWRTAKIRMQTWLLENPKANQEAWGLGVNAWYKFDNIEDKTLDNYLEWLDKLNLKEPEHNQSLFAYFFSRAEDFMGELAAEGRRKAVEESKRLYFKSEGGGNDKETDTVDGPSIDGTNLYRLRNVEDEWSRPSYAELRKQIENAAEAIGDRKLREDAIRLFVHIRERPDPAISQAQRAKEIGISATRISGLLKHLRGYLKENGVFSLRGIPRPSFICRLPVKDGRKTIVKRTVGLRPECATSLPEIKTSSEIDPFLGRPIVSSWGSHRGRYDREKKKVFTRSSREAFYYYVRPESFKGGPPPKGAVVTKIPTEEELRYDFCPRPRLIGELAKEAWIIRENADSWSGLKRLLTRGQFRVFISRYWGEKSHEEIAEELGMFPRSPAAPDRESRPAHSSRELLSRGIRAFKIDRVIRGLREAAIQRVTQRLEPPQTLPSRPDDKVPTPYVALATRKVSREPYVESEEEKKKKEHPICLGIIRLLGRVRPKRPEQTRPAYFQKGLFVRQCACGRFQTPSAADRWIEVGSPDLPGAGSICVEKVRPSIKLSPLVGFHRMDSVLIGWLAPARKALRAIPVRENVVARWKTERPPKYDGYEIKENGGNWIGISEEGLRKKLCGEVAAHWVSGEPRERLLRQRKQAPLLPMGFRWWKREQSPFAGKEEEDIRLGEYGIPELLEML